MNKSLDLYAPDGGSFFSCLEERLCHWFRYDTLKREDWPEWSDEDYLKEAKRALTKVRGFNNYLRDPYPNPYDIRRYQVPVWHQAMIVAYEGELHGLDWVIRDVCKMLNSPQDYHDLCVELAEKIQAVLLDPELPKAAQERIAELKQKYGCKE